MVQQLFKPRGILLMVVIIVAFVIYKRIPSIKESNLHIITLTKDGFLPSQVLIHKGGIIKFVTTAGQPFWPASDLHPTHLIYPEFDPKKPVPADQSWSFVFGKVGTWRFHDHLSPNFTGVIIVEDGGPPVSTDVILTTDCSQKPDLSTKEQCWNDQLAETLRTRGLDQAFSLFIKLYDSEPDVPKSCHGWTHTLGKAAFDLYDKDKSLILRKEVSYCGYGFFHGFMEKLLQTTGDVKKAKDFCDYASSQLGTEARGTYQNCIHGIGHGSVDVDNTAFYGDFQAMAGLAINRCKSIFTLKDELSLCLDGVFNSMEQSVYLSEYGLKLKDNDLFYYCRTQDEQSKSSCYPEFTGLMEDFTHHNFKMAVNLISKENLSPEISVLVYRKLAADIMQYDIVNKSQEQNVKNCRSLGSPDYEACIHGLSTGFISHGEPGKEYIKGLEFCGARYLNDKEKDICYEPILEQLAPQGSAVCLSAPEEYRKYCY